MVLTRARTHKLSVVARGKIPDRPAHPVRAKDRLRQAGLLAPGSSPAQPSQDLSVQVAYGEQGSPVTVAGAAPDYELRCSLPGSLFIPSLGTCRAMKLDRDPNGGKW
jgi:hypothetical protein